ncbi:unnamed protein product [Arctogadus glacialis]
MMSYLSGSRDTRCRRVPQEDNQSEKRKKPKEKVKSVSVKTQSGLSRRAWPEELQFRMVACRHECTGVFTAHTWYAVPGVTLTC